MLNDFGLFIGFLVEEYADNWRMNTPSATASAEKVINTAVSEAEDRGQVSGKELVSIVQEVSARESTEKDPKVTHYIDALRSSTHDAVISPLENGVGGQFDGKGITIATATMKVGSGGVSTTAKQLGEVADHERYHRDNSHTDGMKTYDGAPIVIIADHRLDVRKAIEGLTVTDTGHEFVSPDYEAHESELASALDEADLTLDDARKAINEEHDLTILDDRSRQEEDVKKDWKKTTVQV